MMDGPTDICIKRNRVYVTHLGSNLLTVYSTDGKYLRSVGSKGKNNLEFDGPMGLDISTELNRIYIAESRNDRIQSLNLDLSFHSIIDYIYDASDVKLTPEEIVVLSSRNPCVSLYSYTHQLIREMIPYGKSCQLKLANRFILDESSNILITGTESHCICVYSYRGEFLHNSVKKEILLIIVTSGNPNHPIQIFRYNNNLFFMP